MACVEPRRNRDGEIISYRIRVNKGNDANGERLKPYVMTYKMDPNISNRQNMKILNEIVAEFERQCQKGTVCDGKQTFQQYAEYAMKIKERRGVKHSTLVRYRQMLKDIYEEIGYVHLVDIKPQMLNQFYESLEKGTARKTPERATPKVDFKQYLKKRKITQEMLHKKSGVGMMTIRSVISGENILFEKAQVLCETLGVPLSTLFKCVTDERGYKPSCVQAHNGESAAARQYGHRSNKQKARSCKNFNNVRYLFTYS